MGYQGQAACVPLLPLTMRLGCTASLCFLGSLWVSVGKHREGFADHPAASLGLSALSASSSSLYFPHFLCLWYLLPQTWRVCQGLQCASPAFTQEQVCGLCGNFDGIQNNDFTSSSLQVEEDPVDFGNSWKVNSQCADTRKVHVGSVWMEGPLTHGGFGGQKYR